MLSSGAEICTKIEFLLYNFSTWDCFYQKHKIIQYIVLNTTIEYNNSRVHIEFRNIYSRMSHGRDLTKCYLVIGFCAQ